MVTNLLLIAVGGAFGAVSRYLIGEFATARFGPSFPFGTLIVNVIGSFVFGLLLGLAAERGGIPEPLRVFVAVGFCGALTTFSTFAGDTLTLADRSAVLAVTNVVVNNALSLGAALVGTLVARLGSA